MKEVKKNIIVVGYPKSGTSWLSKLVAELIECPLKGNWGYKILNDPLEEGHNRQSDYSCYKSHHTYKEIFDADQKRIEKIIYIIRDPRDIVISGIYFFKFFKKNSFINKLLPNNFKKKQMIKAVLYGNKKLNQWCEFSWKDHYESYLNKDIHFIRYEDLIKDPVVECNTILTYLDIERAERSIINAIENQSFKNVKDNSNARKGESGYWKKQFSISENQLFIKRLDKSLTYFRYKTSK